MKAFYWSCKKCGRKFTDGDTCLFLYETILSGNTPVHHASEVYCDRECLRENQEQ
jgi:hypothetical protein